MPYWSLQPVKIEKLSFVAIQEELKMYEELRTLITTSVITAMLPISFWREMEVKSSPDSGSFQQMVLKNLDCLIKWIKKMSGSTSYTMSFSESC